MGQCPDVEAGQSRVHGSPAVAAVHALEDAARRPCVKGGRGLGVDRQGPDVRAGQPGGHVAPTIAAIRALEDAAGRPRIESGREPGVDGQRPDGHVGQTSVAPTLAAVRGLEETATVGPRVEDAGVRGVDRQDRHRAGGLGSTRRDRRQPRGREAPTAALVHALEDTPVGPPEKGARGQGVDDQAREWFAGRPDPGPRPRLGGRTVGQSRADHDRRSYQTDLPGRLVILHDSNLPAGGHTRLSKSWAAVRRRSIGERLKMGSAFSCKCGGVSAGPRQGPAPLWRPRRPEA